MGASLIELKNIEKSYASSRVLGPLSFAVAPGEIVGVVGENGAGKSTLLRIIAGVEAPDAGERIAEGFKPGEIGYVPQELALYTGLTGKQNMYYWATAVGLRGRAKKERCRELLAGVNLTEKADKSVSSYSGGMKRRLNLACALVGNVRLLLLDEPTVGADAHSTDLILETLKALKKKNCAVILVSHHMDEIAAVCDRKIRIESGKMIE
jgi:ABC-type multidrug transport system, ATPase component